MSEYYLELGTANYRENLCRKLSDLRHKEGLPIDIYEVLDGRQYLVRCVFPSPKGEEDEQAITAKIYRYYLARALAEVIFQGWERRFIQKVLAKEYDIDPQEREDILKKTCLLLRTESNLTYKPRSRKNILVKSILEYLDHNRRFDIEGFMNFRAGLYKEELRKQIAKAVNEYALEQEHASFIRLLKKFLDSQSSLYKILHLVIKRGEVIFYDENGRDVSRECLEENYSVITEALAETNISFAFPGGSGAKIELYEDLLISALLKCAPKKTVIHVVSEEHKEMLQILKEVFQEKISWCTGCSLCCTGN